MDLELSKLIHCLGGQLEINGAGGKFYFIGGIKTLSIKDEVLTVGFSWKIKLEGYPRQPARWVHVPEFYDYSVDLTSCKALDPRNGDKIIKRLYSSTTGDTITFYLANNGNHFDPLTVDECPGSLKADLEKAKENFLSLLDLNKIPKVNFDLEKIPAAGEDCRFMRIDLMWRDAVWSFIRIQGKPGDAHSLIYYGFLDEIAEQFSLTRTDIEKLENCRGGGRGGGFLLREENNLEVRGSASLYGTEKNCDLTRSILKEELGCEVK